MPRWEHGSEDRLKRAAMALFVEQGFENTSVVEIAARARVTTRTFFRYFPDKREVLFAGADELQGRLVEKILQAPGVDPLRVVVTVLAEFDWESLGSRTAQRKRQAIIAVNPDLMERDLIKHHSLAVAFIDALGRRGVPRDIARPAAQLGLQIFFLAYELWFSADDETNLATFTERTLSLFASILSASADPLEPGAGPHYRRSGVADAVRLPSTR